MRSLIMAEVCGVYAAMGFAEHIWWIAGLGVVGVWSNLVGYDEGRDDE